MNPIYITKNDYKKIVEAINKKRSRDDQDEALFAELDRATIVEPRDVPGDVITMNSLVVFSDVESKSDLEFWLVFPDDADISQGKISVLSPIGCALLGYKIGDIIIVNTPRGEQKMKVEKILHQPEAHGNYE